MTGIRDTTMPRTTPALQDVSRLQDPAGVDEVAFSPDSAPVTPGRGRRTTRVPRKRGARRRGLPSAALTAIRRPSGDCLSRLRDLLNPPPRTELSWHDPLFADPGKVENDYYRFRNRPKD